ncbi:MAG: hypothetical protein EXR75_15940 [Myxococcales bacterium]|nr:hypothetical protein [Myxococcales bacterium]
MVALGLLPACLERPVAPVEPRTTSTIVERLTQSSVDKIDLLLVIDNSGSMADKQEILGLAVPDLVKRLVNPICVDELGDPAKTQPATPTDDCPIDGTKREFEPILDIHIGVITSSLGGHGADACDAKTIPSENDHGHLIRRRGTGPMDQDVTTWEGKGFLVWDPATAAPSHTPQGETDVNNLIEKLASIVGGAGEVGCGYEASLEAWYRFAVEPDPYKTIKIEKNIAYPEGTDTLLLAQRADFLRPDSLLAIIMLTDENDCSMRDDEQYYFAMQLNTPGTNQPYHLPRARAACATDPESACCRSCDQTPGKGCDTSADQCTGALPKEEDPIDLRCFDQKRRFGMDFLQPISRYVDGLTRQTIDDRHGDVVPNPLFVDLNPNDDNSNIRDPSLVFLAGIVGVPWQDIARKTSDGVPDLINGLDNEGRAVGGFQSGSELAANGTWKTIVGDPSCYTKDPSNCRPADPHMVESIEPRTGTNPVTNSPLSPPVEGEGPNPINGHEYVNTYKADLQYACIFELKTQLKCSETPKNCDCTDPVNKDMNPLCDSTVKTTQERAKAYPGIRHLEVLKGLGDRGIVGSICPQQQDDPSQDNFGYRPAVGALIERLKKELGGQCLPRSLTPDAAGAVSCLIVEARRAPSCDCSAKARAAIAPDHPAIKEAKLDPFYTVGQWDCFCEITQTVGETDPKTGRPRDLEACQNELTEPVTNAVDGAAVNGWCYIDATTVPPTGDPELVANCPATEQRLIRFVGEGNGAPGATLFITCSGE